VIWGLIFVFLMPPASVAFLLAAFRLRWWLATILALSSMLATFVIINFEAGLLDALPFLGRVAIWMVPSAAVAGLLGERLRMALRRKRT
jgi:hypothetical protein